jgi:hypothetical protein
MNSLPVRPDVKIIEGHRNPTLYELKVGYGAIHYKDFDVDVWKKPNGTLKRWIVCQFDGLRYYR